MRTYGDPANPPILFLHGIRLGGGIFEPHARALAAEFFVVTPDLPGHGALENLRFDAPTIDAFFTYIADDVVRRPPVIVGYSLGGYIAMRYAADRPSHSSGLVLTGCTTDIVGYRRALYNAAVRMSAPIPQPLFQRALSAFFHLTLPREIAGVVIPFRFNHDVFEQSLQLVGDVRYGELLRAYAKPVLIVNGRWDLLFRRDEAAYARAARARVAVIPGADHVAPLRAPDTFCELVATFARKVFSQEFPSREGDSSAWQSSPGA